MISPSTSRLHELRARVALLEKSLAQSDADECQPAPPSVQSFDHQDVPENDLSVAFKLISEQIPALQSLDEVEELQVFLEGQKRQILQLQAAESGYEAGNAREQLQCYPKPERQAKPVKPNKPSQSRKEAAVDSPRVNLAEARQRESVERRLQAELYDLSK